MSKEKIYFESGSERGFESGFESGEVIVTSSRVVIGELNYILRNISAVQVQHKESQAGGFIVMAVVAGAFGFWMTTSSSPALFGFGLTLLIGAGIFLLTAFISSEEYFVQVSSGGTPTNTLKSDTKELPTKVVDAINSALLDLDKLGESEKSDEKSDNKPDSSDEIMKLKGLLDAGAITQEEFDAKKKELLGL
jgi:hypothetical protein